MQALSNQLRNAIANNNDLGENPDLDTIVSCIRGVLHNIKCHLYTKGDKIWVGNDKCEFSFRTPRYKNGTIDIEILLYRINWYANAIREIIYTELPCTQEANSIEQEDKS